jgi:hypothetical protein
MRSLLFDVIYDNVDRSVSVTNHLDYSVVRQPLRAGVLGGHQVFVNDPHTPNL